jgi:hypothetical protein
VTSVKNCLPTLHWNSSCGSQALEHVTLPSPYRQAWEHSALPSPHGQPWNLLHSLSYHLCSCLYLGFKNAAYPAQCALTLSSLETARCPSISLIKRDSTPVEVSVLLSSLFLTFWSLPWGFHSLMGSPSIWLFSPSPPAVSWPHSWVPTCLLPSPSLAFSFHYWFLSFISMVQGENSSAPPDYFDQRATGWFCSPCLSHVREARSWPRSVLAQRVNSPALQLPILPLLSFLPFHPCRPPELKPLANQLTTPTTGPYSGKHRGKSPVSLSEAPWEWDSFLFWALGTSFWWPELRVPPKAFIRLKSVQGRSWNWSTAFFPPGLRNGDDLALNLCLLLPPYSPPWGHNNPLQLTAVWPIS